MFDNPYFLITVSYITKHEETRENAYTVETIQIQCLCDKREAEITIVKKVKMCISKTCFKQSVYVGYRTIFGMILKC